jgi:hypothetical protein
MNLCKINIAPEHEMQVKVSYPLERPLSGGAPSALKCYKLQLQSGLTVISG